MFEDLYIIPDIMIYSFNQGDGVRWKSKFKNFLKFYERDFGQVSMRILQAELDSLEEQYSQSKTFLPDSVSTKLKSINFPFFPFIKTALSILGTLLVTSCSCERLSVLAVVYIHVEIDSDPQSILEKFIAPGPHRLELELWNK